MLGAAQFRVRTGPAPQCPANSFWDSNKSACICNPGYHVENGRCVQDSQPPPIQCPEHGHLVGSSCVCDTGYYMVDGICYRQPEEPPDPEDPPVPNPTFDNFQIAKVYPTVISTSSPGEVYVNRETPWVLPGDNIGTSTYSRQSDGSWRTSSSQQRLNLWGPDNRPFWNAELSVYAKFFRGGGRVWQPYIGGGDHTDQTMEGRCDGFAYKMCLWDNGDISFRKELCHAAYTGDRGRTHVLNSMWNRWIGFKVVKYVWPIPNPDRVRLECWVDNGADNGGALVITGNQNRWRRVVTVEDVVTNTSGGVTYGSWTSGGFSQCDYCANTYTGDRRRLNGWVPLMPVWVDRTSPFSSARDPHRHSNCGSLRSDGADWAWMYYDMREVDPKTRLLPAVPTVGSFIQSRGAGGLGQKVVYQSSYDLLTRPYYPGFDRITF